MTDQDLMRQQVLAFVNFVNLEIPLPDTLNDREQHMARLTNAVFTILRHELDIVERLGTGESEDGYAFMIDAVQVCGSTIGSICATIVSSIGTDDDKVDEARKAFARIAMEMMQELLLTSGVQTTIASERIHPEATNATQH